jgi:hypothetical protein
MSASSLVLENRELDPSKGMGHVLYILDIVYLAIFAAEMLAKMACMGVIGLSDSYLAIGWNRLDFIIVIANILNIAVDLGSFSALRALRVLRPLRLINRSGGMRAVVDTIVACFLPMFNVVFLSFLAYLTFGILGVKFFSGKLNYCHLNDAPHFLATNGAAMTNLTNEQLYMWNAAECMNGTLSNHTAIWAPPRKNFVSYADETEGV